MSETPMYQMKMSTPEGELILPPVFTIRDPLRWTKEKPTSPGWYWHRGIGHYDKPYIEVVNVVFEDDGGQYFLSALHEPETRLNECDASDWFAGPIPQPTDQPGEAGEANE